MAQMVSVSASSKSDIFKQNQDNSSGLIWQWRHFCNSWPFSLIFFSFYTFVSNVVFSIVLSLHPPFRCHMWTVNMRWIKVNGRRAMLNCCCHILLVNYMFHVQFVFLVCVCVCVPLFHPSLPFSMTNKMPKKKIIFHFRILLTKRYHPILYHLNRITNNELCSMNCKW